jgi:pyruvate-ferredoxin/flavodoxin oxidoreductase
MDGNQAAAHVSYAYSDVAAIYPITPSSNMAEATDEWANAGRKNIFGQIVSVTEMQSEAGAAGAVHGSLIAGALTTTFTASQGLLLMIPNLYKIAGEQLPGVFNVAARAIAGHALSIFGDHSDVYACRQTGACILASGSVQEVMDLTPVAHLAAMKGKLPFINFFDGFRTSHEIQKIEAWDYETLKDMMDLDAVRAFRQKALNPSRARQMGSAQNPDIFFQAKEAGNMFYNNMPSVVESYMQMINEKIGTDYGLFNYYGAPDATHVIIAMGSVCSTVEETVDFMNDAGAKVGVVKVHLYRPFSREHLLAVIPDSVQQISVLDRTKEPGAMGEPLYLDIAAALRDTKFHNVPIFSGRYGLGSKDTNPGQIKAVFDNKEKKVFTIGIIDDVTHLSLETADIDTASENTVSAKFWGLGSDGTVGANKNSIKIIGDHTDKYVQAYFDYDSKKSGGVTVSHLRFGDQPIKSAYLVDKADFVACHNQSYIKKYDMVQDLKKGGTFLLNCTWDAEELDVYLPAVVKRYIAQNKINFYIIDGIKIGKEIGLKGKINTILQSAFFALANIIPAEEAMEYMKAAAKKSYGKKGDEVVQMNYKAIDAGAANLVKVEVPTDWAYAVDEAQMSELMSDRPEVMKFVETIQKEVNAQRGNKLPVSAFVDYADGSTPSGTSAHERRSVAIDVPEWIPENCIQCNRCSFVCPHAVIRPVAMTEEEKQNAPENMKVLPMTGVPGMYFAITISASDCTGCGSCAQTCPGMRGKKALVMKATADYVAGELEKKQAEFDYGKAHPVKTEIVDKFKATTVKGSQFKKPFLEFSGACAGCGETPYAKLVTQLFGDRMYIANATGCSSIWGNSAPSTPYTTDAMGRGPAWSNSLFEDAAEFGYGMLLAQKSIRARLRDELEVLSANTESVELKDAIKGWTDTYQNGSLNGSATDKLIAALETAAQTGNMTSTASEVLAEKDFLAKKSQWIFGGDGWAYDIGFGGLDHVLASGQDINVMVFDTELYSNTGGQSSKATPTGSIAKFAAGGKAIKKKDLASIAMSYGYVYVAQIAMGADFNQCVKAIAEAEAYEGPSLIIAYAPCINHGIKAGMGSAQTEEERAVKSGYWHLFRYNPDLKEVGKNAFVLDSKIPTLEYQDFLDGEVRYSALKGADPEKAAELFGMAEAQAKERMEYLQKLVTLYGAAEEK